MPERNEIINALALTFGSGANARVLLDRIGYPRSHVPADSHTGFDFWLSICSEIEKGVTAGGLGAMVKTALQIYPHNQVFRAAVADAHPAAAAPALAAAPPGWSLLVRGCDDIYVVLDNARFIAGELGLPGSIEIDYHSAGIILLSIAGMSAGDAERLERELVRRRHA